MHVQPVERPAQPRRDAERIGAVKMERSVAETEPGAARERWRLSFPCAIARDDDELAVEANENLSGRFSAH